MWMDEDGFVAEKLVKGPGRPGASNKKKHWLAKNNGGDAFMSRIKLQHDFVLLPDKFLGKRIALKVVVLDD